MRSKLLLIGSLMLLLSGCAATTPSTLSVVPDVRRASQADDWLFKDMLGAVGGVGFVDRLFYPNARQSSVIRIEVVSPCGPGQGGSERWHIQHDGADNATYLITFIPDGKGGTYFSTFWEQQDTQPSGQ